MSGTITHYWDGTKLVVTSDSGTSSADLKGERGVRGAQGAPGEQYTPTQGIDYWTDAEKEEFASAFAASGYGYGEPMVWIGFDTVTWKETGTFETELATVFGAMKTSTCKQVQFMDSKGLNSQKYYGTLWKYTADYGVLTAFNYSGLMAVKTYYSGKWEPWEWNNPPMMTGVEYRTMDRYNNKPVYVKAIELGTLPASGQSAIYYSKDKATLVSYEAYAISSSGNKTNFPLISSSGTINGSALASGYTITVTAHTDLSNRTGYAIVRYTLD